MRVPKEGGSLLAAWVSLHVPVLYPILDVGCWMETACGREGALC